MKKFLKNNLGITLVSLVVTIMVLLILVSVAIYSGIDTINYAKYTKFVAELKIMQTYVNQWYEELKPSDSSENWENKMKNKFENETIGATKASGNTQAQIALSEVGLTNDSDFYLLEDKQITALGIEGVSQAVLVNVKNRTVVSYLGLEYNGNMYYILDENDLYNVEYDETRNFHNSIAKY